MRPHPALTTLLAILSLFSAFAVSAQGLRDLNLQPHGYVNETFSYSTNNNWNTTNSTGTGSFRWTEAVGSFSASPAPRLRVGAQARLFLLGAYGPKVSFDWASGEYKFNERFGIRAGKVKSPAGLFNETQDIDPAFLWTLLPQSIYPLSSRNGNLAVRGGLLFGAVPLGEFFGKLDYRVFGGERVVSSDDGYFDGPRSAGVIFPHGTHGPSVGGNLTWTTPLPGLLIGFADAQDLLSGDANIGPLTGRVTIDPRKPVLYGRYERRRLMIAGEYSRIPLSVRINLNNIPAGPPVQQDQRAFYLMTSYKLASKLTAGAYYASAIDLKKPPSDPNDRYQKDWTLSSRYDLNPYLYVKLEQHFIDGNYIGFSLSNNPNGLQETSRLSLAKLGVTF